METIILNQFTIDKNRFFLNKIYCFLELLEDEYPYFKDWYFMKVSNNNYSLIDRTIILKLYNGEICAVSIIKNSEEKICTFRVLEKYQGLKIGTELMQNTIDLIKNEKPLITISEDRIEQFLPILKKFDFKLYGLYEDYYKLNKLEYSYNKPIEEKPINIYKPELII